MILLALALAGAATAAEPAQDVDIYIGMVASEPKSGGQAQVILTRCDLAHNRYRLQDSPGNHDVARFRDMGDAPALAEVIGHYRDEDGQSVLLVDKIANARPGSSCAMVAPSRITLPLPVDRAFSGHYVAGADMADLQLLPEGGFTWAKGGVERQVRGKWGREGDTIRLTAEDRDDAYRLGGITPWAEAEEQAALDAAQRKAEAAIREICPWAQADGVMNPSEPYLAPIRPADARAALDRALAVRARYEAEAAAVMARGGALRDSQSPTPALFAWPEARDAAINLAREAGLPRPEIAPPRLPAACALPKPAEVGPPAHWRRGIIVDVRDNDTGLPVSDVMVRLHFATDEAAQGVTDGDGHMLYRGPLPAGLLGLSLGLTTNLYRAAHVSDIMLDRLIDSGVVHVLVDQSKVQAPLFDEMVLTIKGRDLTQDGKVYRRR